MVMSLLSGSSLATGATSVAVAEQAAHADGVPLNDASTTPSPTISNGDLVYKLQYQVTMFTFRQTFDVPVFEPVCCFRTSRARSCHHASHHRLQVSQAQAQASAFILERR